MDGRGMPLGGGEAPLKEIINYAVSQNITMVVESETLTPSGLAEAEICMNYLKNIE
jgi:hypothetical protein